MKRFFAGILMFLVAITAVPVPAYAASKISKGSTVKLAYSMDVDGVTVVSPKKKEGMVLVVGDEAYPPDFEKQLLGLRKGDKRTISLKPEQAFGPYRTDLLRRIPRTQLPPNLNLQEGQLLGGKNGQRPMRVAKILPDSVVMDQNHPLAGKTVTYQVEIAEVR